MFIVCYVRPLCQQWVANYYPNHVTRMYAKLYQIEPRGSCNLPCSQIIATCIFPQMGTRAVGSQCSPGSILEIQTPRSSVAPNILLTLVKLASRTKWRADETNMTGEQKFSLRPQRSYFNTYTQIYTNTEENPMLLRQTVYQPKSSELCIERVALKRDQCALVTWLLDAIFSLNAAQCAVQSGTLFAHIRFIGGTEKWLLNASSCNSLNVRLGMPYAHSALTRNSKAKSYEQPDFSSFQ